MVYFVSLETVRKLSNINDLGWKVMLRGSENMWHWADVVKALIITQAIQIGTYFASMK